MSILKKTITTAIFTTALFSNSYADNSTRSIYNVLPTPSQTSIVYSLSGNGGARYVEEYFEDSKSDTKVLQNLVTLRFGVSVNGQFQLIGDAMTGGHYKGAMNTFDSIEGSKDPMQEIHIRRLFARARLGDNVVVEGGAMAPTDNPGSLVGLGKMGWVDGGRLVFETESGEKIEVTAGKLSAPTEVDAIDRAFGDDAQSLDIIEVKISGRMFDALAYQAGIEKLGDDVYGKLFTSSDIEVVSGHLVRLVAEGMVNVDNGGHKFRAGFEREVLKAFNDNSSGLIFYADYLSTSNDFGAHNNYVFVDGQGTGEKVRLGFKHTLSKKHKAIIWYVNYVKDLNTGENQVRTGLQWKFGYKKR